MATQELEDIVNFIETQLNTISQLDTVVYLGADDPDPEVNKYGAMIYIEDDEFFTTENLHIGSPLTETWKINVDIIIKKKSKSPRKSVSDTNGVSFWIRTIKELFLNKTNEGLFKRTLWLNGELEEVNSGIKIHGLVTVEILNK